MELKYRQGEQVIQRAAILETVSDWQVLQVEDAIKTAELRAMNRPRERIMFAVIQHTFKGPKHRHYTVCCE